MEQTFTATNIVATLREQIVASKASWSEDALLTLEGLHKLSLQYKGWPAKTPALVNHLQLMKVENMTNDQAATELTKLCEMVETPAAVQAKVDAKKAADPATQTWELDLFRSLRATVLTALHMSAQGADGTLRELHKLTADAHVDYFKPGSRTWQIVERLQALRIDELEKSPAIKVVGELRAIRVLIMAKQPDGEAGWLPLLRGKWYPIRHANETIYSDPFSTQQAGELDERYRTGFAIQSGNLIIDGIKKGTGYARYKIVGPLPKIESPAALPKVTIKDKAPLGDEGRITLAAALTVDRSGHLFFLGKHFVLDVAESPIPGEYSVMLKEAKGEPKWNSFAGNTSLFYKRKEAEPVQTQAADPAEKVSTVVDTPAVKIEIASPMISVAAAHKVWLSDKAEFKRRSFYTALGTLTSIERLMGPGSEYVLHIDGGERILAKGEEMLMQNPSDTTKTAPASQEVASAAKPAPAEGAAPEIAPVAPTELTPTETDDLTRLEGTIKEGLQTFMDVGAALAEINERRLYRKTHSAFADYCRERWDLGKSRAYQLMNAAVTAKKVSTVVDIPAPENERQMRPLSQLAPERRPEAWQKAAERAGEQPVTEAHVQAVVDEMLGKVGRFDNDLFYPVDQKGHRIFNVTAATFDEASHDPRFVGCTCDLGRKLNMQRQYDAFSLVEVPQVHPQDMAVVLPSLKNNVRSFGYYPVDKEKRLIYDAYYEEASLQPTATYNDCLWTSAYSLRSGWNSVVDCIGEYQVMPARVISSDWLKTSAFQPGMTAVCPECVKQSWNKAANLGYLYEKWKPIEEGYWRCSSYHRIKNDALTFVDPAVAAAAQPDNDTEEDDIDDNEAQARADKFGEVFSAIAPLDDLLKLLRADPGQVREALDDAEALKEYRAAVWNYDQPTAEAVGIVRNWLDALAALPDLAKPVAAATQPALPESAAQDEEDDLDEDDGDDQDFDDTEEDLDETEE